jgi:hypothetical protein
MAHVTPGIIAQAHVARKMGASEPQLMNDPGLVVSSVASNELLATLTEMTAAQERRSLARTRLAVLPTTCTSAPSASAVVLVYRNRLTVEHSRPR